MIPTSSMTMKFCGELEISIIKLGKKDSFQNILSMSEEFRIRLSNQVVVKVHLRFFGRKSLYRKNRSYMPKNKIVRTGFNPKFISGKNQSFLRP